MRLSQRLRALLILLLLGCVACTSATEALPTVLPTANPDGNPAGETSGASPRLDDSNLPPTWTPAAAPPRPSGGSAGAEHVETDTAPPSQSTPSAPSDDVYVVQPGDTLAEIAIEFDISLAELAALNGIEDIDHIEVGQRLQLPPSE